MCPFLSIPNTVTLPSDLSSYLLLLSKEDSHYLRIASLRSFALIVGIGESVWYVCGYGVECKHLVTRDYVVDLRQADLRQGHLSASISQIKTPPNQPSWLKKNRYPSLSLYTAKQLPGRLILTHPYPASPPEPPCLCPDREPPIMLSSLSSSISNARQSIAQVLNFALVLSTAFMMVGPHHIPSTDGA
jgi:hypothetical protein